MGAFLERLKSSSPGLAWETLAPEAGARLERFTEASPLYAGLLEQNPGWVLWLENPATLPHEISFPSLLARWSAFCAGIGGIGRESPGYLGLLRRFRRQISLHIAYRDVAGFAPDSQIVEELTRLAEFCLRECYFVAAERWSRKLGEPWDELLGRPARFCALALGKLGGRELNFSSDVDLVYLYEGEGQTRRDGRPTTTSNAEYFQRVGDGITQMLNQRDAHGFLFRVDLRLRPGGSMAPLVPSLEAVENYYAATGQTWERLALLKARPVVGDLLLGAELLENLHSFRYPRHPPPSLLAEVAAMKVRTELEVVGADALERNVKSGYGGIREIEFFAQALQLLHAGRFPFLQTHSTLEALRQLVRYELVKSEEAAFLTRAYWFLRKVEHRVQMLEERQTHELPAEPVERGRIARSLGFASVEAFDARLAFDRVRVRDLYGTLFHGTDVVAREAFDPWWAFFGDDKLSAPISRHLAAWFGDDPEAARELRLFVRGSDTQPLLRDQVQRFSNLVPVLDRVVPRLARPRETLRRISAFAESYGSRGQFLAACMTSPQFFEVLALLFDRSRFIHELLARHPEIFEEVLRPAILRKRKDAAARRRELAEHKGEPPDDFIAWLWLYVRAEQVRTAIGQLRGYLEDDEVAAELSGLAQAALLDVTARVAGDAPLLVVALGKFGGAELTFGSDLDVVFLGDDAASVGNEKLVRSIRHLLSGGAGRDPTFTLDLRLRPHGDAGPLVPSVAAYRAYFAHSAQAWERQVLTRARVLPGPPAAMREWAAFLDDVVYGPSLGPDEAAALWHMRLRIQNERDVVEPRERAFKTGAGGLIDVEFALQLLQLRHGAEHPGIRTPNTRDGWQAVADAGLADADAVARLLDNHGHLQRLEWCLRRDQNRSVSVVPDSPEDQQALARWLEAPDWTAFWEQHRARMHENRAVTLGILAGVVPSTALETDR